MSSSLSCDWLRGLTNEQFRGARHGSYSRAAILKKGFILGDTPTFMQKNVYFLESVVVEK